MKSLWSDVHLAEWLQNIYIKTLLRAGESSETWRILNNKLCGVLKIASDPFEIVRTRLKEVSETLYGCECLKWYETEKNDPLSSRGLPACPCRMNQANSDTRFEDEPMCSYGGSGCQVFHNGAYHCVRSVAAR